MKLFSDINNLPVWWDGLELSLDSPLCMDDYCGESLYKLLSVLPDGARVLLHKCKTQYYILNKYGQQLSHLNIDRVTDMFPMCTEDLYNILPRYDVVYIPFSEISDEIVAFTRHHRVLLIVNDFLYLIKSGKWIDRPTYPVMAAQHAWRDGSKYHRLNPHTQQVPETARIFQPNPLRSR